MKFGLQSDIAEKMREIESSTNEAQKTLNLIKTNLKGQWDSSRFEEAQKLAQKSVEQTKEKLASLRSEFARISSSPDGIQDKDYKLKNLGDEILATENRLQRLNKQLAEVNELNLNRLIKSFETAGDKLDKAAQKTKYFSAAAVGAYALTSGATETLSDKINQLKEDYESATESIEETNLEFHRVRNLEKSSWRPTIKWPL